MSKHVNASVRDTTAHICNKRFDDLTGRTFGKLTVLELGEPYYCKSGVYLTWRCKCECGTIKDYPPNHLRSGKITACGCQKKILKGNAYKVVGDVIEVTAKDKTFLVDAELEPLIKSHTWHVGRNGYVSASNGKLLHRLIMENSDLFVDHINGNRLDNRRQNLRFVTMSQNGFNKKVTSNTGFYGISKTKKGFFVVSIMKHYIGMRKTLEEAVKLRNSNPLWNEIKRLNFQLEKEGYL